MFKRSTFVLLALCALGVFSPATHAETPGPGWEVTSATFPTNLSPGGTGTIAVNVYNIGAVGSGGPVTVTDTLPAGIIATEAGDLQNGTQRRIGENGLWECSVGKVVRCINNNEKLPSLPWVPVGFGNSPGVLAAGYILHIAIAVKVEESTSQGTLTNNVTVAGGGALAPASTSAPIVVGAAPASSFGFEESDGWLSNANGTVDTQAGSHPYEFTYSFDLNTEEVMSEGGGEPTLYPVGGQPRDLVVNLPPGFVGNSTAVPECTRQQFEEESCPPATQVGLDTAGLWAGRNLIPSYATSAVYNLVPQPGLPAQFAFDLYGLQAFLDVSLRSGGDYGLTVHANNIPQIHIMGDSITFWGEPSDPSHDKERFANYADESQCKNGCSSLGAPRIPFLTTPTSCVGPQRFSEGLDTWETAGFGESSFALHDSNDTPAGFTGCDRLGFGPSISVAPDTSDADTPAGVTVDVRVAQEGSSTEGQLATSNIKDTTAVLPAGMVINPGVAPGLQFCQQGDVPGGDDLPLPGENGEEERFAGPADCPNASKVGTVQVLTPLLKEPLEGGVYVLQSNPPNVKLLITASGEGVYGKLIGDASLCEQAGEVLDGVTCQVAGQVIARFAETPEIPFTDFKLSFSGGAQAALATPTQCGQYQASGDFTPWSTPEVGDAFSSSNFAIDSGPNGSACPSSTLAFTPSMVAGATTDQAGGYTGFSLLINRLDDQQRISKLQFKTPLGLLGMISHVTLCGEPQAARGECPAGSQIGHTVVGSGPGPYPLYLPEAGRPPAPIYITGPYDGAPYGLSIVVPVLAGPFNLGTVVVRGKIEVDPQTSQLTITTDPLIQTLDGVPADLRTIDAVIDRKEFMFNPTNCDPQSFSGTVTSIEGATAPVSSPFQVGSCRSLAFKPTFKASTTAKTSRIEGASLHVTLTLPDEGGLSSTANVQRVKVSLPKQLPSPLKTLQKACLEKVFAENPTGCPKASQVGQVKVSTPVLPGGLTGTAYFVSHGGAKYPELIMVLTGQNGVTVQVHGETFISKQGITSATFNTVPDVPFSDFELTLPEREYPALTANGSLCQAQTVGKLLMPTEIAGQNGLVIKQSTKIAVTGCPKHKKAAKRVKRKSRHNTHSKKR